MSKSNNNQGKSFYKKHLNTIRDTNMMNNMYNVAEIIYYLYYPHPHQSAANKGAVQFSRVQ